MKILTAALNSKFVHTSLALRTIRKYAEKHGVKTETAEYTINMQTEEVVADLYEKNADVYGFSLYIFNKEETLAVIKDLKKLRPNAVVFCGGPEASFDCESLLSKNPEIDFLIRGEGEKADLEFFKLALSENGNAERIKETRPGSAAYIHNGEYVETERRPLICDLDEIPFPYEDDDLVLMKDRILYYESSRGCPFSCSYCMSSLDKKVRVASLARTKSDIDRFLAAKVRLVKFVDRTFNFDKKRTHELLKYIIDNDNGVTEFHFEISLWLLSEETLKLLADVRKGLFRFEIGIQTANKKTLAAINRKNDVFDCTDVFSRLKETNVHLHTDLIAGLPFEDMESFLNSLDKAFALGSDCLQLGFLKVLHGTEISTHPEFEMTVTDRTPYEILKTKWLGYEDIRLLKKAENALEILYNGGLMKKAFCAAVEKNFGGKVSKLLIFLAKDGFFDVQRKPRDVFAFFAERFPNLKDEISYDYFKADLYTGEETFLAASPDLKKAQALLYEPQKIAEKMEKNDAEVFLSREAKKWLRHTKVVRLFGKDTVFIHLPKAVIFTL